jgi:hypothetical protein
MWLQLVRRNDALVFVRYSDAGGRFFRRQIHLARLFGGTIVRWRVGSDVLSCLRSDQAATAARQLDLAVDLNIAAAPHLVDELRSIGVRAEYVPSVCDLSSVDAEVPASLPSSVLAYLPTDRKAFYGEDVVISAAEANPHLRFIIVGDDSHSLARYPNVQSLGWVDDMHELWPRVGLLLRVTEHDGLPRMVLEALARGRYVIYSWPLEGCWFARSRDCVLQRLEGFGSIVGPNTAGREVARRIGADAGRSYVRAVARQRSPVGARGRLASLLRPCASSGHSDLHLRGCRTDGAMVAVPIRDGRRPEELPVPALAG